MSSYKTIKEYRDNFKPSDPSMAAEQELFANFPGPYSILSAGAGSGKTYTIEKKIDFLTKTAGLSLDNILALSFTRTAASNLSARYKGVKSMTFDAFSADIFAVAFPSGQKLIIADDVAVRDAMLQIQERNGYKQLDSQAVAEVVDAVKRATPKSRFSTVDINQAIGRLTAVIDRHQKVFEEMLIKTGIVSFNIRKAFTTAHSLGQLPKEYENISYLIIDEAQDSTQPEMVMALSLAVTNNWRIAIVGDASQNISEWRGVKPEAFLETQKLGGFEQFSLQANYRSEFPILHTANQLLAYANTNEKAKIRLHTPRQVAPLSSEFQKRVHLWQANGEALTRKSLTASSTAFSDHYPQTQLSAKKILKMIEQARANNESFAILARSNVMVQAIATELNNSGANLYTKPLTERASTYRTEVTKILLNKVKSTSQLISNLTNQTSISLALKKVMKQSYPRFLRQLQDDYLKILHSPSVTNLINQNEIQRAVLSVQYMITRLEAIENAKRQQLTASENSEALSNQPYIVATFHSSKGLEWDHVLIVDETLSKSTNRKPNQQEELRLAYVAITRAKKSLDILQLNDALHYVDRVYTNTKPATMSNPFGQAFALAIRSTYDDQGRKANVNALIPEGTFIEQKKD